MGPEGAVMQEKRCRTFFRIHTWFLSIVIAICVTLFQFGEGGQARIPEEGSDSTTLTAEFPPSATPKPFMMMPPLPVQEVLVASLTPSSRPNLHSSKTRHLKGHRLESKQRLGLALLLLGMLAEEQ